MARNLYITATEAKSGKSAIALGVMHLLLRDIRKVAFFRPVISGAGVAPSGRDHDINLILSHFNLDMDYADTYAYTFSEARELINDGRQNELLESILAKYKGLESRYDFVLCEGTDSISKDAAFEQDLNAEIAANLGCPIMLVANGKGKSVEEILASTQIVLDSFESRGLDIISTIINRATVTDAQRAELTKALHCKRDACQVRTTSVIPEEPILAQPTMEDVRKWLNAEVLYGHSRMDALVSETLIAAMQIDNFLAYYTQGALIITPGDRSDIILSSLAARTSTSYPDLSGLLLTGGIRPPGTIRRLIEGWSGTPLPILSVKDHTYKTVQTLNSLVGRIDPDNDRKINTALGLFERHVDGAELAGRLINRKSSKVTPMMFEFMLIEQAKRDKMRIVLPEGEEERILLATDILLRREVADIILLGDPKRISEKVSKLGVDIGGATVVQPNLYPKYEQYANAYYEFRKAKGVSLEQARDTLTDNTYFGTMMVKMGDADGMVSGSINTTAHTLRPAFEFIKTKPGFSIVSSVFFMCLKDRVLAFGDCAVNPNPTAEQLAEIAVNGAQTAALFGIEPRVAMLSYSTGTSGKGEDVDRVREATRIAKERAPELLIEGPIQYDAAIDPSVARTKMPDSPVAGQATVFIFPDLNTGNNTYKAVQRAADAIAIGPVLQGLNKPVNDLSRGCTVPDIVNTVAITAIQAQVEKK